MDNTIIKKYDKQLYESGPVKYTDYINNKYDNVHHQLYIDARNKLIIEELLINELYALLNEYHINNISKNIDNMSFAEYKKLILYNIDNDELKNKINDISINSFLAKNKIIELKDKEYYKPSKVMIISKYYPYKKQIYKLDKYWNYIDSKKNIEELKLDKNIIKDSEIIFINYVSGKVTMYSKVKDLLFDVSFDYINHNTKISEQLQLNQTFSNIYKNL